MGNIASFEYRIVKYKETNKIGLPIEERRHSNNFTNTAIKQSIIITTSYPGSLPSPGAAPCVDKDLACEVVIIINKGVSPSSVYIDGICSSLRPSSSTALDKLYTTLCRSDGLLYADHRILLEQM